MNMQYSALETITPEVAAEMLAKNKRNRPIRPSWVARLAGSMERGEWLTNGETIKVCVCGDLLDGQHRCAAVVQSGVPIVTFVVRNVPCDAYSTIDQGSRRTLRDTLALMSEGRSSELSAALLALYIYRERGNFNKPDAASAPSSAQLLHLLDAEPNLRLSVSTGTHVAQKFRRSRAIFTVAHYLLSSLDASDAEAFFGSISDGTGMERDNPIYRLRERLLVAGKLGAMSNNELAALIFKAWNLWRAGETVRVLSFKQGGAAPEAFPVLR